MLPRWLTHPRAILLAALPLLGWWLTGLFDLDEGFYGAVVAEMNRRHEWVTPYYNGRPWFEKPILLYWLAKPTIGLFGFDFGPRLPSVLCSLATVAIVGVWGEKRLKPGAGILATLVLGSSLLPVALGRMMMTDPPLVLCLTVAFLGYWEAMRRPWFLVLVGFALGVGVLAKGPVALLLFLPPIVYLATRTPKGRELAKGGGWLLVTSIAVIGVILLSVKFGRAILFIAIGGLSSVGFRATMQGRGPKPSTLVVIWTVAAGILIATVSSWYVLAYAANGDAFVQKFLIEQNLGRFRGGDEAHSLGLASLPAYIPIVLLGMVPWSGWLWTAWRNRSDEDHRRGYLWAWAGTIFIFFSISGAKLPHYVLPLFPALALLVADRLTEKRWAPKLAVGMTVFMFLFANVGFAVWYRLSGQQEAHALVRRAEVREAPAVAVYQIGRRDKDRGTGRPKLQETSLPSLPMYMDRTAQELEKPEDIAKLPVGSVVFTRTGRIEDPLNHRLTTLARGENYVLYRKTN